MSRDPRKMAYAQLVSYLIDQWQNEPSGMPMISRAYMDAYNAILRRQKNRELQSVSTYQAPKETH